MGASFDSREYRIAGGLSMENKRAIASKWKSDVESCLFENGHSYSGGIGMLGAEIDWRDKVFDSISDAEEWIQDNHEKWENGIGVKTKDGYIVIGGWCSS